MPIRQRYSSCSPSIPASFPVRLRLMVPMIIMVKTLPMHANEVHPARSVVDSLQPKETSPPSLLSQKRKQMNRNAVIAVAQTSNNCRA